MVAKRSKNDGTIRGLCFSQTVTRNSQVGKNMVNSIRFWLRGDGLIEQVNGQYVLSGLAESIQKTALFRGRGTWWTIHYHLVSDPSEATTWYWFSTDLDSSEFDEETFLHWLTNYTLVEGTPIAEFAEKNRYFVNTYLLKNEWINIVRLKIILTARYGS